ncbi:hypothetical protein C8J57DRAFT_1535535 [Mycena rebaudengoi]|nr:hypothetical protein C8J57DRAFT_1535535 [Mycena rebaudengoi]
MSKRQRQKASVPSSRKRPQAPNFSPSELAILDDITEHNSSIWKRAPALQRAIVNGPALALDALIGHIPSPSPSPPPPRLHLPMYPPPLLLPTHPTADNATTALPSQCSSSPESRPLSPDLDEREVADIQHAVQLSLSDVNVVTASAASSSAGGQAANAVPSAPPHTSSQPIRQPRITTQLNPAWMAQAVHASSTSASDTFNPRQPAIRKPAVNIATVHRFTLVYWDDDNKSAAIRVVDECPSWPLFRLSESRQTLASLGDDIHALQFYDLRLRLWVHITTDYTHSLTPNGYLLLRRAGVTTGLQQNELIDTFTNLPGPQNIRYNLPAERDAVRQKLRAVKRRNPRIFADDDSDVEIVPYKEPRPKPEAVILRRPILPPIITEGTAMDPIILESPPPSSSSSRSSTTPSLLFSRSSTPSTTPTTPLESSASALRWPRGMYTVDMAEGFLQMEGHELGHLSLAARFCHVFGSESPYVAQTYRDQRRRWTISSEALRTKALAAGRTAEGLWSEFQREVPLK